MAGTGDVTAPAGGSEGELGGGGEEVSMAPCRERYWRQYNSWEIPGKGERGKCEIVMEDTLLETVKRL